MTDEDTTCPDCEGTGYQDCGECGSSDMLECDACGGTGEVDEV